MSLKTIDEYLKLVKNKPLNFNEGSLEIVLDKNKLLEFEKTNNCNLGIIYKSKYNLLVRDLVHKKNDNNYFAYERIIKPNSNNAIVIIPKYNNDFILLNQFRHALRENQLCFPRGFGEPNLSIENNAKKEIKEELNSDTISCTKIGNVVADSGLCGEKVNICLCEITKPTIKKDYEGIENIIQLNDDDLHYLIKNNQINDGFTLSALALLKNYCK